MNVAVHRFRQLALALLFVIAAIWIWGEAGQWLLRWRAQRLLSDIRALQPGQSTWSDAQRLMAAWSHSGTSVDTCTGMHCKYEIDLVQALPPILVGSPAPGAHNWIARTAILMGVRGAAVRAGFTVQQGVLTSNWFGEQVTVPLRDWGTSETYIPYLSVSARQAALLHPPSAGSGEVHPMRLIHHEGLQLEFSFSSQEPAAIRSAFYNFRLACITRLHPCETPADMLPEGWQILQQK